MVFKQKWLFHENKQQFSLQLKQSKRSFGSSNYIPIYRDSNEFISFCSTRNSQKAYCQRSMFSTFLVIFAVSVRAFFVGIEVYFSLVCCKETTRTSSMAWGHFWGTDSLTHHYFCTNTKNTSILENVNNILVLTWRQFWPCRTMKGSYHMP